MPSPVGLTDQERCIFDAICAARGRVVTRTELARAARLPQTQARRVDVLLVNVRRALGDDELVNVRSRGWMLQRQAA
jgi:DNA-binding response OmpR family regulator